ncbi:MAG: hypothetical protein M1840_007154 [Geoglossum simile]|nr:MAG: hypothetical protein M1840_007154 [Geoglossum simile]
MPHKHRRSKTSQADGPQFELPPTVLAKSLPATAKLDSKPNSTTTSTDGKKAEQNAKRKSKNSPEHDTPKSFSRLLQFQKTGRYPSGLDDGKPPPSRKRKRNDTTTTSAPPPPRPTILPGERLSSFSARVDAALPISGLITKHPSRTRTDPVPGLKVRKTKLERRMQKMYDEWRTADARLKERRIAAVEEVEDDDDDAPPTTTKKRKSKRTRRNGGNNNDDDDDPWAHLLALRNEPARRALNDVVQAPPQLTHVPKPRLGTANGIPKAAGSLRRREELGSVRKGVVEGYRALMEGRRGGSV